ncbi:hypothetical protein [Pantoea dispersa]|uniref:hypothetical protein n=1 Tax=Pantoea dispersa TaxID=59814 RepID=UPI00123AEEA5|nr:hypothetical protein [Pantoea dispersa]KAA8672638.1 hypothetical protein F4W08_06785 [Pantoea dispersa]
MRKKKEIIAEGICKLTGKKGKFVDSHILPRALTLLSKKGERAIQKWHNGPETKRFQGWYDNQLVIQDGESILRDIDDKAIKILRRNHLVWSGWPTFQRSLLDEELSVPMSADGFSFRIFNNIDTSALKVFFLSIVWRAAASTREDMSEVVLHPDLLERLRIATLTKSPLNYNDFPIRLHQIYDRGIPHNRTPIIERQEFDLGPPYAYMSYLFCRIYLDGLIAHVALDADDNYCSSLGNLLLGNGKELGVIVNPFNTSRSFSNLKEVML